MPHSDSEHKTFGNKMLRRRCLGGHRREAVNDR